MKYKSTNTRMMCPFDMYRKGQIAHKTTHAFLNRANEYKVLEPMMMPLKTH